MSTPRDLTNAEEQLQALFAQFRLEGLDKKSSGGESIASTEPVERCYFLDCLPREIRIIIYKLLLVNEDLGTPRSAYGDRLLKFLGVQYGLTPALLRTCHQIHNEAKRILYGSNVFALNLTFPSGYDTPIRRFSNMVSDLRSSTGNREAYWDSPAIGCVQHWRLILPLVPEPQPNDFYEPEDIEETPPDVRLVRFCRHLAVSPCTSLEVLIMPEVAVVHPVHGREPASWVPLHILLKPLEILRKIQRFVLKNVPKSHLPIETPDPDGTFREVRAVLDESNLDYDMRHLTRLVTGCSPVVRVFLMHEKLLAYAQAFERYEPFKHDMDPKWGVARETLREWDDFPATQMPNQGLRNPFLLRPKHPVEIGLMMASVASENDDVASFLIARKEVFLYLEAQYKRLTTASLALNHYIEMQGNLLSCKDQNDMRIEQMAQCIVLLEDYARAFVRDVPINQRAKMRLTRTLFTLIYAADEREGAIEKLNNALSLLQAANADKNKVSGRDLVKSATDHMNKQYNLIRATRNDLLQADP